MYRIVEQDNPDYVKTPRWSTDAPIVNKPHIYYIEKFSWLTLRWKRLKGRDGRHLTEQSAEWHIKRNLPTFSKLIKKFINRGIKKPKVKSMWRPTLTGGVKKIKRHDKCSE